MAEEAIPKRLVPPLASDEWKLGKKAYKGKKNWGVRTTYHSMFRGNKEWIWDKWYTTEKQRDDAMIGLAKSFLSSSKRRLERIER